MTHDSQGGEESLQELFLFACEQHQSGKIREAKNGYLEILKTADNPLLRYNLGLIYCEEGDFARARDSFLAADRMQGGDIDTLFNLAICHKATGDRETAVRIYRQILDRVPRHLDALYNLAGCCRELKRFEEAAELYREVLAMAPDHTAAINNLAYSCQMSGNSDEALRYYALLLEHHPDHQGARHMVDSLLGHEVDTTPEEYVRDVFDSYSGSYDENLVGDLEYSVPIKMRLILDGLAEVPARFAFGIDLGCGTGLSGAAFDDLVETFHGVDLSAGMLAAAKAKNIYARLTAGNILDVLRTSSQPYDFILAADVLAYIGRLDELFAAISGCAGSEAVICFSTETSLEERFSLRSTGRFAHNPHYVRGLAAENGWFEHCCQAAELRKEAGEWVAGNLWVFRTGS